MRQATVDDADGVADLETARVPDEPRDGSMVAFWWTHLPGQEKALHLVGERDGTIDLYAEAGHGMWEPGGSRYGRMRVFIHPRSWGTDLYATGLDRVESWLRSEQAQIATTKVREDLGLELASLAAQGYREVRRHRHWELDLAANRDRLLATAELTRAQMSRQGIELITLDRADDPAVWQKVCDLDNESTEDIPTTQPFPVLGYKEWAALYFENPGIRKDRFWIARLGEEVVGMSLIEYPPGRGVPATEYTGTSPRYRGRGIARSLKYATVAQAIQLGAIRVRTDNDSANAPILHLNEEMGYRPTIPYLELHRDL